MGEWARAMAGGAGRGLSGRDERAGAGGLQHALPRSWRLHPRDLSTPVFTTNKKGNQARSAQSPSPTAKKSVQSPSVYTWNAFNRHHPHRMEKRSITISLHMEKRSIAEDRGNHEGSYPTHSFGKRVCCIPLELVRDTRICTIL